MPTATAAFLNGKWHLPDFESGKTLCGIKTDLWEKIGSVHKKINVNDACPICWEKSTGTPLPVK